MKHFLVFHRKRYLVFIFLCHVSFLAVKGQQDSTRRRMRFHSINQVGLLVGQTTNALSLQSINGIQHRQWFAGIGVGLDYYQYRSVPVFADFRYYLKQSRDRFFVYANAGPHFTWEEKVKSFYPVDKYYPGFYGNAGIGYQLAVGKKMGFMLSMGYTYKRTKYRQTENGCPFVGPCVGNTEVYVYDYNRLTIQAGWKF